MTGMQAKGGLKKADISVRVIRADGTVDDYGKVASTSRWFRWGPGRWLADRRTRRLNRRVKEA